MVMFDSPPALAASPASVLAMMVGQVMMVVRADRTPENEIAAAVALLDACEHIALVLNAVSFVPGAARFGSYYGQEDRPVIRQSDDSSPRHRADCSPAASPPRPRSAQSNRPAPASAR